jgi:enamine deaminase RidA (YjgF/YER057c/UK114 family)
LAEPKREVRQKQAKLAEEARLRRRPSFVTAAQACIQRTADAVCRLADRREGDSMTRVAERLEKLGIVLPRPAPPVANYVPSVRAGALLIVSGQLPLGADGKLAPRHVGKLGPDSGVEAAREAARLAAINVLAQAQAALGDLDHIARVVRLGGFFSVEGNFDALPQAMNGASDLIAEVFGEKGRHARTTVGVAHLPLNAMCEVEALFEVAA